jgi:hypothetical protein
MAKSDKIFLLWYLFCVACIIITTPPERRVAPWLGDIMMGYMVGTMLFTIFAAIFGMFDEPTPPRPSTDGLLKVEGIEVGLFIGFICPKCGKDNLRSRPRQHPLIATCDRCSEKVSAQWLNS